MQQLDKKIKEALKTLRLEVSNGSDGAELLLSLYKYQGILEGDYVFFGMREETAEDFKQVKPYKYKGPEAFIKYVNSLIKDSIEKELGLYFSISLYCRSEFYEDTNIRRKIEFVSERTCLVNADLDEADYKKSIFRPLLILDSSPGSTQAIYDIGPSENRAEYRMKQLILKSQLDKKTDCVDPCRFIRVPGSYNFKPKRIKANGGKPPKVGNVQFRDLNTLYIDKEELKDITDVKPIVNLKNIRGFKLNKLSKELGLNEELKSLLKKNMASILEKYRDGRDRSTCSWMAVCELLKFGCTQEQILNVVIKETSTFQYFHDKWKTKDSLANQINQCVFNAINNPKKKERVTVGLYRLEVEKQKEDKLNKLKDEDLTKRANINNKYIRKDEILMVEILKNLKIDYDVIYYDNGSTDYKIQDTTDNIKRFCKFYNIELYLDIIKKQPMIEWDGDKPRILQMTHATKLRSSLKEDFGLSITPSLLYDLMLSVVIGNKRNIVLEKIVNIYYPMYLENQQDYITDFCNKKFVFKDNTEFNIKMIHKWFLQSILLLQNVDGDVPTQFIPILYGEQRDGKTYAVGMMAPPELKRDYYRESVGYKASNKDKLIESTNIWFGEAGEFNKWFDENTDADVKAFTTSCSDSFRAPYARNAENYPRISSYFATVNKGKFLTDETGSGRFITMDLKKVIKTPKDSEEYNQLARLMWGQAYSMFKDDGMTMDDVVLTEEERAIQNKKNSKLMVDANGVEEFFKDRISTGHKGYGISKEDLWEEYQKYCPRFGYSTIKGGKARFNERLVNLFKLESTNKNLRNDLYGGKKLGRKQYWNGLRLIENLDK